jgi:hypothetical protein
MVWVLQELTSRIIAAAIQVHKHLGPGLLEIAYQTCLAMDKRVGLLLNFNEPILKKGIRRFVMEGKDKSASLTPGKVPSASNSIFPLRTFDLVIFSLR